MDFSSFLTSLGTSFIIFLVLMLLFAWLSRKPGNDVVYYPNRILKGLDLPESRTRIPFSWIKEALSSTEADVVSVSSVDTAVYFVFITTARYDIARLEGANTKRKSLKLISLAAEFIIFTSFISVIIS